MVTTTADSRTLERKNATTMHRRSARPQAVQVADNKARSPRANQLNITHCKKERAGPETTERAGNEELWIYTPNGRRFPARQTSDRETLRLWLCRLRAASPTQMQMDTLICDGNHGSRGLSLMACWHKWPSTYGKWSGPRIDAISKRIQLLVKWY
jgi:hypothetical protein